MAKSSQASDENMILSKYAAGQTQFFKRILHFQRKMRGKR